MKNKKKLAAFSMIELSIVLLVVGIMVAGVTGSRKLVALSNFTKARALTNSAPVSSMNGLLLWVETTSKNSFDNLPANGSSVLKWKDINTQQTLKNDATAGTAPTYIENSINGLPAIRFNGTSQYLQIINLQNSAKWTLFVVARAAADPGSACATGPINREKNFQLNWDHNDPAFRGTIAFSSGGWYSSSFATLKGNINYIFSGKTDGSSLISYKNGQLQNTTSVSGGADNETLNATIAKHSAISCYWAGDIGEIIMFNRALTDSERSEIESYLSRKWGIKLT